MFREVSRSNRALPREECIQILKDEKRGVLSVIGDGGYPYGTPLNHFYNDEDGMLYFHSGLTGHRTDSFRANDKASYCVYGEGKSEDGGWALRYKSVIVFGRIVEIKGTDRIYDIARRLGHKFTDDDSHIEDEIAKYGPVTLMFALKPEHITGKRVLES